MLPEKLILSSSEYISDFIQFIKTLRLYDVFDENEIIRLIIGYIADIDEADNNLRELYSDLSDMYVDEYGEHSTMKLLYSIDMLAKYLIFELKSLGVYNVLPNTIVWYTFEKILPGNTLLLKKVTEYSEIL